MYIADFPLISEKITANSSANRLEDEMLLYRSIF